MFVVFHQNMYKFGGNQPVRNLHYTTQMGLLGGAVAALNGGACIAAAGYTELLNDGLGMHANLPNIALALDPGLTNHLVIEVGTTIGNYQEFIGIAWDPNWLTVQHAGQVVWDSMNRQWIGNNTAAGAFPVNRNLTLAGAQNLGADQRGLAYIACLRVLNGNPFIIGFFHNMYAVGDKTRAVDSIDTMTNRAKTGAGLAYAGAEVIVGGDFNVLPPPAANPARKRFRATVTTRVSRTGGGVARNTTMANPYDYWNVSDAAGITDVDARRYTQTRWDVDAYCSDHAGITVDRT